MAEHELQQLESSGWAHGTPADGMECLATMEDITLEDSNYVEFQSAPSLAWSPCMYSEAVVRRLLDRQFEEYVTAVQNADCEADLKRRLGKGPPIWLEDKHALPLPEGDTHVVRVWFASNGKEYSAKLRGALEGEARQQLWDDLRNFLLTSEKKEEDKKEEDKKEQNKKEEDKKEDKKEEDKEEEDKEEEDKKEEDKKEEDKKESADTAECARSRSTAVM